MSKRKDGKPKISAKGAYNLDINRMRMSKIAEVLRCKELVIGLIETEQCQNLTQAADILKVSKLQLHRWYRNDTGFRALIDEAQQIQADRLEQELDAMNIPVAKIFRLKKLRPEYRDNYRIDVTSDKLENMLADLKKLSGAPLPEGKEVTDVKRRPAGEPGVSPVDFPGDGTQEWNPLLRAIVDIAKSGARDDIESSGGDTA